MTRRKDPPVSPPSEFGDLAEAFANPTGLAAARPLPAEPVPPEPMVAADPAVTERRGPGRPRSEVDLVNQTLSIRADQLRQLHRISAAEYARLGRRVLPSEVVRALLDRALSQPGSQEGLLG
jgi:hypothetical protein